MTWHPHRTKAPRPCDQGVGRHPARWNLTRAGHVTEYLCDEHARRAAETYRIDPPPS